MIIVSASDVGFSYGTDVIIKNISLGINEGDKVGFVGVNGAGKSMFFHMLVGDVTPTTGSIFIAGDKRVGYLAQDTGLDSDSTVYDEMLLSFPELLAGEKQLAVCLADMNDATKSEEEHMRLAAKYTSLEDAFRKDGGYAYRSRVAAMLKALGFSEEDFSRAVNSFSGGQKTRLALSRLLLSEPDILMLDEPTNHLDIETLEWLEDYLVDYPKTLLVISHDRYFLDKVTGKTYEIENGVGKMYTCAYTEFVARKEKDRKNDQKAYDLQQKEIARLEAFVENQRKWNRERNIIAAESRLKAIDRMVKVDKPENLPDTIRFRFASDTPAKKPFRLLVAEGLSKEFSGKKLFSDVSFEVHGGDKLFVLGENGIGKSTLLKILCGKLMPNGGKFRYAEGLTIGYYDQEQQELNDENTVIDELWECFPDKTQTEIRTSLASFLFTADDVFKQIRVLSGGERARLTFAKLMLQKSDVLILDEPTNHLDAPSREVLENALQGYDGTLICVSHDRYFIGKLASRIVYMSRSAADVYEGNYADYLAHRQTARVAEKTVHETVTDNKADYLRNKEEKNRQKSQEKKLASTEKAIAEAEARLAENARAQEECAADYEKLSKLYAEKELLDGKLDELYGILETLL